MVLKIGGLLALFLACTAAGFLRASALGRRVRELEDFLGALAAIASEIRYSATPTEEILEKLGASPQYRELRVFAESAALLRDTRDVAKAWTLALEAAKPSLSLDEGDLEALGWFGAIFGATDTQGQLANCERYTTLLAQRLDRAREDQRRRGRMYSALGLLAGTFFCVFFL